MSQNDASCFRIGTPEAVPAAPEPQVACGDVEAAAGRSFGLSAWCIAPAIGGVAVIAAFPSAAIVQDPSTSALYIIFNAAVLLAGGFIGALVLFFIFGRSRPVASIAFTLVVAVITAGRFAPTTVAGAQAAVTRVVGLPETDKEEAAAAPAEMPKSNLAALAASADTQALSSAPVADLPPRLVRSANRWIRTASELAATYRLARDDFESGGGLDFSRIHTRRECNDRLSLLVRLQHANESYAGYINSAPQTLRKLLREDNVPETEVEALADGFVDGFDYDLQVDLRHTRAEFISSAQAMLQLAREREGQWARDPGTGLLSFKSEKDTRVYAEHAARAAAAAARDLEIQRTIDAATQAFIDTYH